ncbi:MAG: hypothetical protein A2V78_03820 [Betaproteobacteria bacterium RBG_16_64_18]|nr:MAG: hypothetical protein A2V78_03820 [Betaproteobacteria bacterium RBG_16_64_18]OGA44249.1 MAG: hypothetical protein A3G26_07540 [Betaproteobacteria bacterium RIFCSPLOWO2_12_FULL_65_110]
MPEELAIEWVLIPIGFLGALVYGITGFGSALVTIPLATHFVPLPFALAVFVLQDFSSAVRVATENPRNAVKAEVVRMVPIMIVGTVLGATLLVSLPRKANMLALGTFVLLYGAWSLARRGMPGKVGTGWAYLAGFCGGLFGMLFGAGGPPYAIYLSHRDLSKEQFRATMSLTSIFSIGVRAIGLALMGLLLRADVLLTAALVVPTALVAVALATRGFRLISRELLLKLVALLLLATGVSLIARALN